MSRHLRRDRTDVAQQVLGDRTAAARLTLAFELAVDDAPVEVEEGERLQLVGDRIAQHAFERRLGDRASAQAGDDRVAVQLQAREGETDIGRDDAAKAHAEALFDDDDALSTLQRPANRRERERTVRLDAEHADLDATV